MYHINRIMRTLYLKKTPYAPSYLIIFSMYDKTKPRFMSDIDNLYLAHHVWVISCWSFELTWYVHRNTPHQVQFANTWLSHRFVFISVIGESRGLTAGIFLQKGKHTVGLLSPRCDLSIPWVVWLYYTKCNIEKDILPTAQHTGVSYSA